MRLDELQKFKEEMRAYVAENLPLSQLDDEQLETQIETLVMDGLAEKRATIDQKIEIVRDVYSSVRGFDVLDAIMRDEAVTQIMINGPDHIFTQKDGRTTELDSKFEDSDKLEQIIRRIVSMGGGTIDEDHPLADVCLPDGSRVSAALPPVAVDGPAAVIRRADTTLRTMEQLVRAGVLSDEAAQTLAQLVRARYNICICGGAAVGKSTLLHVLTDLVGQQERVIAITDASQPAAFERANVVRLEAGGTVTPSDLIRTAQHMGAQRIILGEVRGEEASDLLQAMNAGFDGSMTSARAFSPRNMLSRLETMCLTDPQALSAKTIRRQIAASLDIIVQLTALHGRIGTVTEITEVAGYDNGKIALNPLYICEEDENSAAGEAFGVLKRTSSPMHNDFKWSALGVPAF